MATTLKEALKSSTSFTTGSFLEPRRVCVVVGGEDGADSGSVTGMEKAQGKELC